MGGSFRADPVPGDAVSGQTLETKVPAIQDSEKQAGLVIYAETSWRAWPMCAVDSLNKRVLLLPDPQYRPQGGPSKLMELGKCPRPGL